MGNESPPSWQLHLAAGGGNDQVDLSSANAPVLSDNFTQEAWVYSDNITLKNHYRSIMGSEQGVNAAIFSPTTQHQQFLFFEFDMR